MKIVFMGTPQFSVPTLEKLIASNNIIEAVYTKKAKKSDRGFKLQNTPVYEVAEKHGLKIFTPPTFKNGKNLEELKEMKPDLIVVVAYGLILPKELLEIPTYGCINLHPSLLPKYRGCAPMERCLLSNDTETGVCVMQVAEGVDNGDIIDIYKCPIDKNTDISYLKEHLSEIGSDMMLKIVEKLNRGEKLTFTRQNDDLATFTDKIINDDAKINWQKESVVDIHNKIRALNDSVGVYLYHNNNRIKLLKSDYSLRDDVNNTPATDRATIADKFFSINCKDGILQLLTVQREGKKAMSIKDFVNGYRFNIGDKIE